MSKVPAQVGPYSVEREIGRGGMGVVYLGYDGRLDRQVAIKALPAELDAQAERLARFEIEAKALAQVNHPNIAQIHGVEEVEGQRFLILEYVDGETLADRLDRGVIATEELIELGLQVAAGLEAAHAAGITHRDLKPANLKLTADGVVKILDFGLAKAEEGVSSSTSAVPSQPTVTTPRSPTEAGVILGTAPYMSPEQARGRKVDKRTDIWAFGVVLYECLTGANPFVGETATDSLGAVLHREPSWQALPKDLPPGLRRLLRRCMTRDKSRRLQDIADARVELEELRDGVIPEDEARAARAPARGVRAAYLAVLAATLAVAVALWWTRPAVGVPHLQRYSMHVPESLTLQPRFRPLFDVSRDGRRSVVLATGEADTPQLHVRDADQREFRPLRGTDVAFNPKLSPDAEWVAFVQNDVIRKVSARGGPSRTIMEVMEPLSLGSWTDDGWIYFTVVSGERGVYRVSENGGAVETVTVLDDRVAGIPSWPAVSPDGVLLFTMSDSEDLGLYAVRAEGGDPQRVAESASMASWVDRDRVLFARAGTLMAAAVDPMTGTLEAEPVPVLEGVCWNSTSGGAQYSLTGNGDLFHLAGSVSLSSQSVVRIALDGQPEPLGLRSGSFWGLQPNADESRFVYFSPPISGMDPSSGGLSVVDVRRNVHTRLASSHPDARSAHWSPDGEMIFYSAARDSGGSSLYRIRADGSAPAELLYESESKIFVQAVSQDGRVLYCVRRAEEDPGDVVVVRLEEEPREEELVVASGMQSGVRLSPDGHWMVYVSEEGGTRELYLHRSDATGPRIQVSDSEISFVASWSPDGTRVYYGSANRLEMMMVEVELPAVEPSSTVPVGTPLVSPPRALWQLPSLAIGHSPVATRDGEGFFAVMAGEGNEVLDRIEITLGFVGELDRLLPASR